MHNDTALAIAEQRRTLDKAARDMANDESLTTSICTLYTWQACTSLKKWPKETNCSFAIPADGTLGRTALSTLECITKVVQFLSSPYACD